MPRRKPVVPVIDAAPDPAAGAWADGALTVRQAAAFSGQSRAKLFDLMRSGAIVWGKPGKRRVIARASLVRWLAACEAAAGRA